MSKRVCCKPKEATCRFCQEKFMTGGNSNQTVCFKPECRGKLHQEWRGKERLRKKMKKTVTPITKPKRLCLKCDCPIRDGHLCDSCRRENSECYEEAWGTSCLFNRR